MVVDSPHTTGHVVLSLFMAIDAVMEQVMGIEPTLSAWEADALPLSYTCMFRINKPKQTCDKLYFSAFLMPVKSRFASLPISIALPGHPAPFSALTQGTAGRRPYSSGVS